ncbi:MULTISPECIES: hypothetical protein [unclassified Pseudonocardia]|uniref:hypothetical protein n=1 Tax=unclassified Pseudonocardia TaxID=2619320 RepID=UPI0001FFDF7B|nr:hypothetical protein [Pseudonocardia sp. Ae707_Ps1]OLM17584.1 hypothetical protein Ae707Ps1_1843c [Pseudonocardia sp. Ae707_Ps1]
MDEIAKSAEELGLDPNGPHIDQFAAAVRHTTRTGVRLGRRGFRLLLPAERTPLPRAVHDWLKEIVARLNTDDRTCSHVHSGTATVLFGSRPNVRYCHPCADGFLVRLAQRMESDGSTAWSCDVCGNDADLFRLAPFCLPFASILLRGLACDDCLNEHQGEGVR